MKRPPPPQGTRTASIAVEMLDELEPDSAVAGHDGVVHDGMDEEPVDALHTSPPPSSATSASNGRGRRPPRRSIGVELRRGRVVGDDDRRGHARARAPPTRPPAPCSRRSSSTTPSATASAGACRHRVRRAADLERADRLQALELEPDLARPALRPWSRTSGVRTATPAIVSRGALDLGRAGSEVDLGRRRRARARGATQSSAAARSSTARPSDLNTVSSSSARRPGCTPTSSSPSSALMWSGADPGLLDREQIVARLVQRGLAPVDEERRRRDGGSSRARARSGSTRRRRSRALRGQATRAKHGSRDGRAWCRRCRRRASASSDRLADDRVRLSASASACARRCGSRSGSPGRRTTACIACTCERPWTPEPRTATTCAPGRASSRSRPLRLQRCGSR